MAENTKTAPQPGAPGEMIHDSQEMGPLDHDPAEDEILLRASEAFFEKEHPRYHALLKRVQGQNQGKR